MKPEVGNSVDYSSLPPVPEGMYECIVKDYKLVDNPYYKAQPYTSDKPVTISKKVYMPGEVIPADPEWKAKQYQFVFEIVDGENAGRWLFKRTGTMLTASDRNHMYKLFSKVIPVDYLDSLIADGDAPDIDDEIVGMPVICVVETNKNKQGKLTNKVTGFMRSQLQPSSAETVYVDSIEEAQSILGGNIDDELGGSND